MISFSRYINIVSGVGAGAAVAQRQLIMRLITQNATLPPGIVAEFANAAAVGSYFGQASEEYKRAVAYFGFVSKSITSPQKISFARWVSVAIAPMVVGDTSVKPLTSFSAVTAGTLSLQSGAAVVNISAINLSTAIDLPAVAAAMQIAIRTSVDPQLTGATVTFNTNTNQFVLTGTTAGSGSLNAIPTGTATDVSGLLGWTSSGTVNVPGQAADTSDGAASKSVAISNNCGSLVYCTASPVMTQAQVVAVAAWNHSQNNMYQYHTAVTLANVAAMYLATKGYSGFGINVLSATQANDYIEQSACEILAATNYNAVGSTQNYMYYQFGSRNITVSDDTAANIADANRANYIGVTQIAGQQLAFYQRGVLCGDATAAVDQNTYSNEQWLKSYLSTVLMGMLLSSPRVPANETGRGQVMATLQTGIDQAKLNGTISAGKTLNVTQQNFITTTSGSATAWRQVATIGYWLNVNFVQIVNSNSGLAEWQCQYTLLYAKDDAIRSVTGSDTLI